MGKHLKRHIKSRINLYHLSAKGVSSGITEEVLHLSDEETTITPGQTGDPPMPSISLFQKFSSLFRMESKRSYIEKTPTDWTVDGTALAGMISLYRISFPFIREMGSLITEEGSITNIFQFLLAIGFWKIACAVRPTLSAIYNSVIGYPTKWQIENFPLVRQADSYTCGAACVIAIRHYFECVFSGDNEAIVKEQLKSDRDTGTSCSMIRTYFSNLGYSVKARSDLTLEDLQKMVATNTPVLIVMQAWRNKIMHPDWTQDWDDGHYVVIIGYDDKNIICMDPATVGHYAHVPKNEFLNRWHDKSSDGKEEKIYTHFGMAIFNPELTEKKCCHAGITLSIS